ncbi:unnamed protein product, partial [marine sediment metagenome]
EGAFDVLTQRNNQGSIIKKVYIYNCNYRVSKIEYFDEDEQTVAVTELYKYKEVSEGCFVPRAIKITTHAQEAQKDSLRIRLKSVKPNLPISESLLSGLLRLFDNITVNDSINVLKTFWLPARK